MCCKQSAKRSNLFLKLCFYIRPLEIWERLSFFCPVLESPSSLFFGSFTLDLYCLDEKPGS